MAWVGEDDWRVCGGYGRIADKHDKCARLYLCYHKLDDILILSTLKA
jgi:hypothetical protein